MSKIDKLPIDEQGNKYIIRSQCCLFNVIEMGSLYLCLRCEKKSISALKFDLDEKTNINNN